MCYTHDEYGITALTGVERGIVAGGGRGGGGGGLLEIGDRMRVV